MHERELLNQSQEIMIDKPKVICYDSQFDFKWFLRIQGLLTVLIVIFCIPVHFILSSLFRLTCLVKGYILNL